MQLIGVILYEKGLCLNLGMKQEKAQEAKKKKKKTQKQQIKRASTNMSKHLRFKKKVTYKILLKTKTLVLGSIDGARELLKPAGVGGNAPHTTPQ